MAYMSQENKAKLVPKIKEVMQKYSMKGSVAVRNHSTLVCNIKSGPINFADSLTKKMEHYKGHISVNPYHIGNSYTGKAQEFLLALHAAMSNGNHDNSDIMTDYFDVGWYIDINVGQWNKPYQLTA